MTDYRVVTAGDSAMVVEFEERIDPAVNARTIAFAEAVQAANLGGVRDVETLAEGHVDVPEARLPQRVLLLRRRECAGGRRAECIAIEPDGPRQRRIPIGSGRERIVEDLVVELVAATRPDACDVNASGCADIERRARLCLENPRDVPVAKHPPQRCH